MKLKFFTLASMVAAGTVSRDNGSSDLKELKQQVLVSEELIKLFFLTPNY